MIIQPITQVYVMYSEIRGIIDRMHIKIGISDNVDDRLKGVQTGNPGKVYLIASFNAGVEASKHENYFHQLYKKYSTGGEWFEFTTKQFDDEILPEMAIYFNKIDVIEGSAPIGKITTLTLQQLDEDIQSALNGEVYSSDDYTNKKIAIIKLQKAVEISTEDKKIGYQQMIDRIQAVIIKERDLQSKINQDELAIKYMKRQAYKAQTMLNNYAFSVLTTLKS